MFIQRQTGTGARLPARCVRRGFTLIEILVVVVVIGVLAALALPNYVRIKEKAKEAEVKAAVHKLQTDLERFAVDSEGSYPAYLIGGDNAALPTYHDAQGRFVGSAMETPPELARDPLLRQGYLDAYPVNPFLRNEPSVRAFQASVGDPLRNGTPEGREGGTRFGPQGNLLGQCLCDARWLQWNHSDPLTGVITPRNTWSNVQYEFYDAWAGSPARPYLPGAFLYKSCGALVPDIKEQSKRDYGEIDGEGVVLPRGERDEITYPLTNDNYILGAWGGARNKGYDILGEEPLVLFTLTTTKPSTLSDEYWLDMQHPAGGPLPAHAGERFHLLGIAPWTRGVNRAHVGPLWGSPYGPAQRDGSQLSNSNPNGLRDGVIITLNGGEW